MTGDVQHYTAGSVESRDADTLRDIMLGRRVISILGCSISLGIAIRSWILYTASAQIYDARYSVHVVLRFFLNGALSI